MTLFQSIKVLLYIVCNFTSHFICFYEIFLAPRQIKEGFLVVFGSTTISSPSSSANWLFAWPGVLFVNRLLNAGRRWLLVNCSLWENLQHTTDFLECGEQLTCRSKEEPKPAEDPHWGAGGCGRLPSWGGRGLQEAGQGPSMAKGLWGLGGGNKDWCLLQADPVTKPQEWYPFLLLSPFALGQYFSSPFSQPSFANFPALKNNNNNQKKLYFLEQF